MAATITDINTARLERIACPCCGTTFKRKRTEHWKKLCRQCYHYTRIGFHVAQAVRHGKALDKKNKKEWGNDKKSGR